MMTAPRSAPVAAPSAPAPGTHSAPGPKSMVNANDDPISILLVDDDPDCRLLIRDAITDCNVGNTVYEVSNGEEAMEFLMRKGKYRDAPRPGLVFLDIEMPGKDGQTVLREIREHEELSDVPVVMMTGVSDPEEIRIAAKNGANSYTIKPASAEAFLKTVLASTNYWLRIHQYPKRGGRAE
jgi:CheY-like chemotaxis protein